MALGQPPVTWAHGGNGVRGQLNNLFAPEQLLRFQYNPTTIKDSKQTKWAEADIPGGDETLDSFGSGKSVKIDFSLFFNVYGEGARNTTGVPLTKDYVEQAINFLYQFAETDQNTVNPGKSPSILLLTLGRMRFPGSLPSQVGQNPDLGSAKSNFSLPVRLASISVDRQLFAKDYTTIRASIALSFVRVVAFPR